MAMRVRPVEPHAPTRESFEAVYHRHFAFTWRLLRSLGVPERDLADAAQDVFVVVHRKLDDFDFRCRVTTWLYGICLRVASGRRRLAPNRHESLGEDLEGTSESHQTVSPELTERRALLRQALDAMPAEQRVVFCLFELEGMTGEEIAELLEVNAATVHSRLRLARETFRRVVRRARVREAFDQGRWGERT
jgi:RNA polymerase sigma-70 factor (ECF subfamily)